MRTNAQDVFYTHLFTYVDFGQKVVLSVSVYQRKIIGITWWHHDGAIVATYVSWLYHLFSKLNKNKINKIKESAVCTPESFEKNTIIAIVEKITSKWSDEPLNRFNSNTKLSKPLIELKCPYSWFVWFMFSQCKNKYVKSFFGFADYKSHTDS